jgi:hypothetical protein
MLWGIIVGLPSLHDAARYEYGDPRLADWIVQCDNEIRDDRSWLDEDRARLRAVLDLPEVGPLLEHFYAGLRNDRYLPIATETARATDRCWTDASLICDRAGSGGW